MQFSSWGGNGQNMHTLPGNLRESIRCVWRSVTRSADSACSHADLPIHHLAVWWKQCEDMSRRACTCTDKVAQGRSQHYNRRLHARPFSSTQRNMDKQLSFPRVSATRSPHDLITVTLSVKQKGGAAMTAVCYFTLPFNSYQRQRMKSSGENRHFNYWGILISKGSPR